MPLVEIHSSLFDSSDIISGKQRPVNEAQQDPDTPMIHLPDSFRYYKPELYHNLRQLFPEIRLQQSKYENDMPLLLAGSSPLVVMPWIMNGDNHIPATMDLIYANAFTQVRKSFGPMVGRLILFSPFSDHRLDTLPVRPVSSDKYSGFEEVVAAVVAQSSTTLLLASLMREIAKVDTLITVDTHSYLAQMQFEDAGICAMNVTTAKLMLEYLRHIGLLDDKLENVIVGVDLGNLPLAHKLQQEEDFGIGIIQKYRIPIERGERSETLHRWKFGNIKGKRVILMDDMISGGGTILETIKLLLKQGTKEILVCASHAVFAGRGYYKQLQDVLEFDQVKIVLVTDTLPLKRPVLAGDKDLAYIKKKSRESNQIVRREVHMLKVDDYLTWLIGVALTEQTDDKIANRLAPHLVPARDPYDLYHEITGERLAKPIVAGKYEEGEFVLFEDT